MTAQTERGLAMAMAELRLSAARNLARAQKAQLDGFPGWAALLRALAEGQEVRSRRCLLLLRGKVGSTEENLAQAFAAEPQARRQEQASLLALARRDGEKALALALDQAGAVEEASGELYARARAEGWGQEARPHAVCQVCGYLAAGQAPARCPVCQAVPEKFKDMA